MTPRQLKYFVEIARSGSITTAASTLHIAQPALSHHVAAMEEELGVTLLERHARGVKVTVEGQRLLERGAAILEQLDRLKDDVRTAGVEARGNVRLCVVGSVAQVLAVPLFRLLAERAPQVRLQLSTGMSREARAMLEARVVDLAMLPTASELTRLASIPAFEETFALFGLDLLFEAQDGPIAFSEIGDRPLIAPDRDHDLRKMVERTAVAQGSTLNVQYELNNFELYRRMLQDGLAFAIMPRNAFSDAETFGVLARDIVDPVLHRVQSVAWMIDQPLTPAVEAVRASLLELISGMVEEGTLKGRVLP